MSNVADHRDRGRLPLGLLLSLVASLSATALRSAPAAAPAPIPVLLDTDLGGDIDDALALALVLASPELDLRGITTVHDDAYTRALIACRFLHAVGRDEIPVASRSLRREQPESTGQFQYGLRPAFGKRPESESAVEFLFHRLKETPGELTLLAIGPLTNVAELLSKHPDCKPWIKHMVLMGGAIRAGYEDRAPVAAEWNIRTDVKAAQTVFASDIPLVVAPLDATTSLKLEEPLRRRLFRTETPLAHQLHALYQLWGKPVPTLFDPVAATLCITERFCEMEELRLEVDAQGYTRVVPGRPNARVATSIRRDEFLNWFVDRLTRKADRPGEPGKGEGPKGKAAKLSRLIDINRAGAEELQRLPGIGPALAGRIIQYRRQNAFQSVTELRRIRGIGPKTLERLLPFVTIAGEPLNEATLVAHGGMPNRVHALEDYETDIQQRWWLCGKLETANVPQGSSRACRGLLTNDFDQAMGDPATLYTAVVFDPVPGPLAGKNPRLSFRYWLRGASLRIQISSLTRGYHRCLVVGELPQASWQSATVDLRAARRPDGSGGPLSEGERIGDIQFYTDASAELLIDDIILYDAALPGETRPFPARLVFAAGFDTGRQGKEWPGDFAIVPGGSSAGRAARSVPNPELGEPWIRLPLRGERSLGDRTTLRFRYLLSGGSSCRIRLMNRTVQDTYVGELRDLATDRWAETTLDFTANSKRGDGTGSVPARGDRVDEIRFLLPKGAELLVDDILLYDPGSVAMP